MRKASGNMPEYVTAVPASRGGWGGRGWAAGLQRDLETETGRARRSKGNGLRRGCGRCVDTGCEGDQVGGMAMVGRVWATETVAQCGGRMYVYVLYGGIR